MYNPKLAHILDLNLQSYMIRLSRLQFNSHITPIFIIINSSNLLFYVRMIEHDSFHDGSLSVKSYSILQHQSFYHQA